MEKMIMDDAALEGITGGAAIRGFQFSGQVRPENCVIGQNYYVVMRNTYLYGQVTELTRRDGKTMLSLRATMVDGNPRAMSYTFNVDLIAVYTTMTVSC